MKQMDGYKRFVQLFHFSEQMEAKSMSMIVKTAACQQVVRLQIEYNVSMKLYVIREHLET
jgi:hypothetical protein